MSEFNNPPWHPITDPRDLKTLGKLGEECGELSAAISRCIIQGIEGTEPTTGKPNWQWLAEEIADVLANINLVSERFELCPDFIACREYNKRKMLEKWHAGV